MFDDFELSEIGRVIAQMIRIGVVSALDLQDAAAPRVKCQSGETETDWIPWCSGRAGSTRRWSAPSVGEQVLILAPGGDPSQAVIIPGIFSDASPAPDTSPGKDVAVFSDGTRVEYDAGAHAMTLTVAAGGTVAVHCAAANVYAPVTVHDGNVTVQGGDVIADGISLKNHTHMVIRVGAPTSPPLE